jgi:hypothetical protein
MKLSVNRARTACAMLTFLLLLGWSSRLSADTVFSNLSGIVNGGGQDIFGDSIDIGPSSVAVEFTSSGNFTFTEAELGISSIASDVEGYLNVYLETSSSGAPGTVIEQIGSDISVPADISEYVTADSSTTPITLSEGVSYWVVATAATGDTSLAWATGSTGAVPLDYSLTDSPDGPWYGVGDSPFQLAIDGTPVTTTPVPEPGTLAQLIPALIGVLGLGLWAEQRRLKAASQ